MMPIYYKNKSNGKIEARYVGCDTSSTKFRGDAYERFEDDAMLALDVAPALSPAPTPPASFDLSSPNGQTWTVTISDTGKLTTVKHDASV